MPFDWFKSQPVSPEGFFSGIQQPHDSFNPPQGTLPQGAFKHETPEERQYREYWAGVYGNAQKDPNYNTVTHPDMESWAQLGHQPTGRYKQFAQTLGDSSQLPSEEIRKLFLSGYNKPLSAQEQAAYNNVNNIGRGINSYNAAVGAMSPAMGLSHPLAPSNAESASLAPVNRGAPLPMDQFGKAFPYPENTNPSPFNLQALPEQRPTGFMSGFSAMDARARGLNPSSSPALGNTPRFSPVEQFIENYRAEGNTKSADALSEQLADYGKPPGIRQAATQALQRAAKSAPAPTPQTPMGFEEQMRQALLRGNQKFQQQEPKLSIPQQQAKRMGFDPKDAEALLALPKPPRGWGSLHEMHQTGEIPADYKRLLNPQQAALVDKLLEHDMPSSVGDFQDWSDKQDQRLAAKAWLMHPSNAISKYRDDLAEAHHNAINRLSIPQSTNIHNEIMASFPEEGISGHPDFSATPKWAPRADYPPSPMSLNPSRAMSGKPPFRYFWPDEEVNPIMEDAKQGIRASPIEEAMIRQLETKEDYDSYKSTLAEAMRNLRRRNR